MVNESGRRPGRPRKPENQKLPAYQPTGRPRGRPKKKMAGRQEDARSSMKEGPERVDGDGDGDSDDFVERDRLTKKPVREATKSFGDVREASGRGRVRDSQSGRMKKKTVISWEDSDGGTREESGSSYAEEFRIRDDILMLLSKARVDKGVLESTREGLEQARMKRHRKKREREKERQQDALRTESLGQIVDVDSNEELEKGFEGLRRHRRRPLGRTSPDSASKIGNRERYISDPGEDDLPFLETEDFQRVGNEMEQSEAASRKRKPDKSDSDPDEDEDEEPFFSPGRVVAKPASNKMKKVRIHGEIPMGRSGILRTYSKKVAGATSGNHDGEKGQDEPMGDPQEVAKPSLKGRKRNVSISAYVDDFAARLDTGEVYREDVQTETLSKGKDSAVLGSIKEAKRSQMISKAMEFDLRLPAQAEAQPKTKGQPETLVIGTDDHDSIGALKPISPLGEAGIDRLPKFDNLWTDADERSLLASWGADEEEMNSAFHAREIPLHTDVQKHWGVFLHEALPADLRLSVIGNEDLRSGRPNENIPGPTCKRLHTCILLPAFRDSRSSFIFMLRLVVYSRLTGSIHAVQKPNSNALVDSIVQGPSDEIMAQVENLLRGASTIVDLKKSVRLALAKHMVQGERPRGFDYKGMIKYLKFDKGYMPHDPSVIPADLDCIIDAWNRYAAENGYRDADWFRKYTEARRQPGDLSSRSAHAGMKKSIALEKTRGAIIADRKEQESMNSSMVIDSDEFEHADKIKHADKFELAEEVEHGNAVPDRANEAAQVPSQESVRGQESMRSQVLEEQPLAPTLQVVPAKPPLAKETSLDKSRIVQLQSPSKGHVPTTVAKLRPELDIRKFSGLTDTEVLASKTAAPDEAARNEKGSEETPSASSAAQAVVRGQAKKHRGLPEVESVVEATKAGGLTGLKMLGNLEPHSPSAEEDDGYEGGGSNDSENNVGLSEGELFSESTEAYNEGGYTSDKDGGYKWHSSVKILECLGLEFKSVDVWHNTATVLRPPQGLGMFRK